MIRKTILFACAIFALLDSGTVLGELAGAEPPSVHVLLKKHTDSDFSISPDGSKAGFVRWSPNGYNMQVYDTATGEKLHQFPFKGSPPESWQWLTNRRVIYSRGGEVSAINIDGTNSFNLLAKYDSDRHKNVRKSLRHWTVMHLLPDDPEHFLAQSWDVNGHPAIVRVNLYTGEEQTVVFEPKLDMAQWAVDRDGDVRLGVRFKKDEMQLLTRDEQSQKWTVYDDYAQDGANTLGHTGQTYLTRRFRFESFDYDDDLIYIATNRNSDKFKLIKYDISKRQVVEEMYASDEYDIGGSDTSGLALLFDDVTESVVGIRVEEERPKSIWFDERFKRFQAMFDEHYPDHDNWIFDWSDDASVLLVLSSSDVDPGHVSVFHPETNAFHMLAVANEELNADSLSKTQFIEYKARDGHTIHGYLNLATNGNADNKLIVIPHGGPFVRDRWHFDQWVQYFATRGYNVLRMNFRGSTGYGREHLLAGIRNLDSLMVDDIADGARWAIANNHADQGKVFIFGLSYGGYAGLISAMRYSDLYSAVVSVSSPLDMFAQIANYKKNDQYFAYEYWRTTVGDPRKEKATLRRLSPLHNIDKISVPFIVFHGERDKTVPEKQAVDFKEALSRTDKDGEVVIIDDEGHGFRNDSNITYVLEKSLRLFAKHEAAGGG